MDTGDTWLSFYRRVDNTFDAYAGSKIRSRV